MDGGGEEMCFKAALAVFLVLGGSSVVIGDRRLDRFSTRRRELWLVIPVSPDRIISHARKRL